MYFTDSSLSLSLSTPIDRPYLPMEEPLSAKDTLNVVGRSMRSYAVGDYLMDRLLFEEDFYERHISNHKLLGKEEVRALVSLLEQANQILTQISS